MSGNGGHPSSLQAATSGAPPFDPGPRASQNQLEIGRRSSPSQEARSNSPEPGSQFQSHMGQMVQNGDDIQMSDSHTNGMLLNLSEKLENSFASGIQEVFPNGISGNKAQATRHKEI